MLTVGFPLPAHETGSAIGVSQLVARISQEGLIRLDERGRHLPSLAREWQTLDNGHRLRFFLRSNAQFSDGSPVTPQAVRASLERSRTGELAQYPLLHDIESIEGLPPDIVDIRLRQPSALLLDDLEVAITKLDPDARPIGTGPYVRRSDSAVPTLHANPYYSGERPQIDVIELKTYSTLRTTWAAMLRGETDFLYEVPVEAFPFLRREANVQVFSFLRPYAHVLVFNLRPAMFRDARVRRALNVGVDRQAIINRALEGRGRPAYSPVWPRHWAFHQGVGEYPYDPREADRLLTEAGYPRKPVPGQQPSRLRFTCLVAVDVGANEKIALMLQKQLFDVGVDMQIDPVSIDAFVQRFDAGDFDAVLVDLNGGPGLVRSYTFWHSADGARPWNFGYRGADAALDALRRAVDDEAIRAATLAFQRVLHDDPPAVFIAWPETARALSRRFEVTETDRDVILTLATWRPRAQGAEAGR